VNENGADPDYYYAYSARFWHTTVVPVTTSTYSYETGTDVLVTFTSNRTFLLELNGTETGCMPGPPQCDFTYSATSCPHGYAAFYSGSRWVDDFDLLSEEYVRGYTSIRQ
jgi:hypothetical protein